MKFELKGLIPSKKNSKQIVIVKGQYKIIPSDLFKKWHNSAKLQILSQKKNKVIEQCQEIEITLYFGTKKKADITNKVESIMDLLVDCKVLADDSYLVVPKLTLTAEYRKNDPGAKILIWKNLNF